MILSFIGVENIYSGIILHSQLHPKQIKALNTPANLYFWRAVLSRWLLAALLKPVSCQALREKLCQNRAMTISKKLLSTDERVLRHMHEHIKIILLNIIATVLILAAVAVGLVYMPDSVLPWGQWMLGILGVVLVIIVFFIPWLKWITTTFTITNRRIITRSGIFNKNGHDIPLSRISNVAYNRSLIDRVFGCGTLILETSADSPVTLRDIPRVEQVHVELTDMLFASERNTSFQDLDE